MTTKTTHLIEAAPNMLEALESVYQYASDGYGRSNSAEQRLAVIDKVWAAIQLAKGLQCSLCSQPEDADIHSGPLAPFGTYHDFQKTKGTL